MAGSGNEPIAPVDSSPNVFVHELSKDALLLELKSGREQPDFVVLFSLEEFLAIVGHAVPEVRRLIEDHFSIVKFRLLARLPDSIKQLLNQMGLISLGLLIAECQE